RTLRERSLPIPKIPASEPTKANRTNEKLWPMRMPAPIELTAAKRRAGPMPATRLAMIAPAANGMAKYVCAAHAEPSKLEESPCVRTNEPRVSSEKRMPAQRTEE